ncbi:MAG: UbiA family prenyltransferase [Planctomycetota bacterium]
MTADPTQLDTPGPIAAAAADAHRPLVLDLDGTLVATDTMWEAFFAGLRERPIAALTTLAALPGGRAAFKGRLAQTTPVDPEVLPYRPKLLDLIRDAKAQGREVWLATGADLRTARLVAEHVRERLGTDENVFDQILATNDPDGVGDRNCIAQTKLEGLHQKLDGRAFDYAGDSSADRRVWPDATVAYLTGASPGTARWARDHHPDARVLVEGPASKAGTLLAAMRPHQWAKNLLLLLPMLTGMAVADLWRWGHVLPAIVAFCLAGSAVYLTNDLIDLPADRAHPRKKKRPLASGMLPIASAIVAIPMLLLGALAIAAALSLWQGSFAFLLVTSAYLAAALAYALRLKSVPMLDVIALTLLYVLRIIAGGVAVGLFPTAWLLAFGSFLFLSLAFAKRYAELAMQADRGDAPDAKAAGRGYRTDDLPVVQVMGVAAGFLAVLVFALYINRDFTPGIVSDASASASGAPLYAHPDRLWLITPLLLYWIARLWFRAHRRTLRGDPLNFAMTDPTTYALVAATAAIAGWAH